MIQIAVLGFLALTGTGAWAQPTYSKEVSRIVADKCERCHRPNDIAPFTLSDYQQVSTFAEDIKRVVTDRTMPPWKPVPGFGDFTDSYGLTDAQRQTILDWVDAGAPEGDPADLPQKHLPTGEWRLGQPDVELTMVEEFTPPRGRDLYRCFVLPVNNTEDRWVSATDVIPGNRGIVHHVILYVDANGESDRLDARDDGPGYTCFGGPGFDLGASSFLGGWAPGAQPKQLPDGNALKVPAGARLVMQIHYYPSKATGPDLTRAGLYFATSQIDRQVYYLPILNDRFEIPAGADKHQVQANFLIPFLFDAHAVAVFPHMHLLGRQIKLEVERIGRPATPMIYIDDWDFNWQGPYQYKDPVALPALSNIKLTCTFDNSANNPRNPGNPIKPVRWGEGTEDEMCIAFIGITFDRNIVLPFQAIRNQ